MKRNTNIERYVNIEINDSSLINDIAEEVVERIKPLLNNSNDSNSDELMDVRGLSDYLKVKESWVYEKIHTRIIPFKKVGKFPRFRKKHIDMWISNPYHPDLNSYNLNHNERR